MMATAGKHIGVATGVPSGIRSEEPKQLAFEKAMDEVVNVFLPNLKDTVKLKEINLKKVRKNDLNCRTGETHFHAIQKFEGLGTAVGYSMIMARKLLDALLEDAGVQDRIGAYPKVIIKAKGGTDYTNGRVRLDLTDEFTIPLCDGVEHIDGARSFADYYKDYAEKLVYALLITAFCHELLHLLQDRIGMIEKIDRKYFYPTSEKGYAGKKQQSSYLKAEMVVESLPMFVGSFVERRLFGELGLSKAGIHSNLQRARDDNWRTAMGISEMDGELFERFMRMTDRLATLSREELTQGSVRRWLSLVLQRDCRAFGQTDLAHDGGGVLAAIMHFGGIGEEAVTTRKLLRTKSYEELIKEGRDHLIYAASALRDDTNWETGKPS